MPIWTRKPPGTYVRPTLDWWAHQAARAAVAYEPNNGPLIFPPCFGIYNDSQPAVYLHILAVTIIQSDPAPPVSLPPPPPFQLQQYEYYAGTRQGPIPADPNPLSTWQLSTPIPLYSNDPQPPGTVQVGMAESPTYTDPFIGPNDGTTTISFFPPFELCVVPPGSAFQVYSYQPFLAIAEIYYYWLNE